MNDTVKIMNVLSLFDGMSCGQIALERVGIAIGNYFASEVDKYAIQITQKNYPKTQQLGTVTEVRGCDLPKIDLLIGGSPCQGFSFAGKQLNFDDPRSALFFEFVRLLKETKPEYFLLENVRMKKEYQDIISEHLGVKPIMINSALVSAQNRVRLYWTNIPNVTQPEDRKIMLKDILEIDVDESFYHSQKAIEYMERGNAKWMQAGERRADRYTQSAEKEKSFTVTANIHKGVPYNYLKCSGKDKMSYRKLTSLECERLQTVPDNYTEDISKTQRYKMIGNGWTVDVIAHILKNIK